MEFLKSLIFLACAIAPSEKGAHRKIAAHLLPGMNFYSFMTRAGARQSCVVSK